MADRTMDRLRGASGLLLCLWLGAACGDDTGAAASGTGGAGGATSATGGGAGGAGGSTEGSGGGGATATGGGAASSSSATTSGAGGTGGTTATSSSASSGGATTTGAGGGSAGLEDVGTLVVLGDSIGDGGGQGPFYYQVLRGWLDARYGGVAMERRAESGSKTAALVGQIDELPGQLAGPVVVTITSGGNDMKDAILQVVTGTDGPLLQQVGANVDAALSDLLAPGRFGADVPVLVFEANIYDASDGQGNFAAADCNFGQGFPALPTDEHFERWNGEIAARVLDHGQTPIDLHGHFYGHGFNGAEVWYAPDCTHPNSVGHEELAGLFYEAITGEAPP